VAMEEERRPLRGLSRRVVRATPARG
jgi:hypothetical protein